MAHQRLVFSFIFVVLSMLRGIIGRDLDSTNATLHMAGGDEPLMDEDAIKYLIKVGNNTNSQDIGMSRKTAEEPNEEDSKEEPKTDEETKDDDSNSKKDGDKGSKINPKHHIGPLETTIENMKDAAAPGLDMTALPPEAFVVAAPGETVPAIVNETSEVVEGANDAIPTGGDTKDSKTNGAITLKLSLLLRLGFTVFFI